MNYYDNTSHYVYDTYNFPLYFYLRENEIQGEDA